MTIAAGFWHKQGVLLCSDAQQEGGSSKIYGPKIAFVVCPGGKIGIALAGNVGFALSAIQKAAHHLRNVAPEDTIAELESALAREYRRLVYDHPDYGRDASIAYDLLISFWSSRGIGDTTMFVTQEHALVSCFERFQAIGIGRDLANVLARPFAHDEMSEEGVLILAAYVLAQVKENVPGCGGISQFIAMRNDGTISPRLTIEMDQIEGVASRYDKAAHELLFAMAHEGETEFSQAVTEFESEVRGMREWWKNVKRSNSEVAQYLLLTKGGSLHQPPSPESPRGSDVP